MQGNGGQSVTLSRTYGTCPTCEESLFPLDEKLALLPGNLAPRQQEHLVHLACFMPFDKVAQMMEELLSVQTHEETVRRLTEQVGIWMEAAQTAETEADGSRESHDQPPLQWCVFSADGAMISLVHKQWAETRTVAVGEPQEKRNADGETEIHVGQLFCGTGLLQSVGGRVREYCSDCCRQRAHRKRQVQVS